MRPKVLVAGGAGYIGSHAALALSSAGFEPVVYDNLSRGHRKLLRFGPFVHGDIHDGALLDDVLNEINPIACMHFAAFAYVAESMISPDIYYANNVTGSLSLLQALLRAGVRNIVFSSSCAVYGQPSLMPISETSPTRPLNPYGHTKLVVENMLEDYTAAFGLNAVRLRYFNACGADPRGVTGEMHNPEPHVIPRALMAASGLIPALVVNGYDYPTPDGTAIRDYTHVSDLAEAHVSAMRCLLDGGRPGALNLGTGAGVSIQDIVSSVKRVTGREVPVTFGDRRAGDPSQIIADPARARQMIGFNPQYAELDCMVKTAWDWFQTNGFRDD